MHSLLGFINLMSQGATYTTFWAPSTAVFPFYVLHHCPDISNTHEKPATKRLQCCKMIKFECNTVAMWQCLI